MEEATLRAAKSGNAEAGLQSLKAQTLEAVLDHMPHGTILCDCSGKLVYANSEALSLLAAADGIQLEGGTVVACDRAAKALRTAIEKACHPSSTQRETLFIPRDSGLALMVSAAPVLDSDETRWVLLMLQPIRSIGDNVIEPLRQLFRLSAAEALVAVRIASGHSLAEIAAERQVSVGTVRAQLKSVAAKLGCSRQVEVAVLVGSLCYTGASRLPA